ncbi:MAG: hypothetical protein WKF93_08980 [Acidimicrobiales bacterium]
MTDALADLPGDPRPDGTAPPPLLRPRYLSWWFRDEDVLMADWFDRIESRPEFTVVQSLPAVSTTFGQEEV